ncbi:hypothetical protein E4U22_002294 [Claviceps purpurea]|nr:hypothetical protein E4U22_002294 [Claviceps purpurea]
MARFAVLIKEFKLKYGIPALRGAAASHSEPSQDDPNHGIPAPTAHTWLAEYDGAVNRLSVRKNDQLRQNEY